MMRENPTLNSKIHLINLINFKGKIITDFKFYLPTLTQSKIQCTTTKFNLNYWDLNLIFDLN